MTLLLFIFSAPRIYNFNSFNRIQLTNIKPFYFLKKKSLKRMSLRFRLFYYCAYTSSNKCKTHLVSLLIQGISQYQSIRSKILSLHLPHRHLQYVPNYPLHLLVMLRGRNDVFDIPFFFHMYDVIS